MRTRSIGARVGAGLAMLGMALGALATSPAPASAQVQGTHQRGPNPTATTLTARGNFATQQVDQSGLGQGYNNVTICYPTDTSQGTFAGVVVVPGFIAPKSLMMWSCAKFASHGFVVAVMEPNSTLDFPGPRADQAQAIIRHLSGSGAPAAVQQRLDRNRWGIMGHSMGGGGALIAGKEDNPAVGAVVALQPFDPTGNNSSTRTPTMIIGATNDAIAGVNTAAKPYYNQISQAEKFYYELAGQGHLVGIADNVLQSAGAITWFKRWLDNDTRYSQLLCPPYSGSGITPPVQTTCPF
jgi:dienelactone hydrolase